MFLHSSGYSHVLDVSSRMSSSNRIPKSNGPKELGVGAKVKFNGSEKPNEYTEAEEGKLYNNSYSDL